MKTNPQDKCLMMSPFRYPGGKTFMWKMLKDELRGGDLNCTSYAEPYAGGAGAAIRLLSQQLVQRIRINDADIRLFCAWHAMVEQSERFADQIDNVKLDIKQWEIFANIVREPKTSKDEFELGFATFYLNRTNRSGIIIGAGPIGGQSQSGEWRLDARFNRAELIRRVEWLGGMKDQIVLSNKDGLSFLRNASKRNYFSDTFFFVDPPYVGAGGKLYLNLMNERKHRGLGGFLKQLESKNWLLTYDDSPLVREIYQGCSVDYLSVKYSLQRKRAQRELLICSNVTN